MFKAVKRDRWLCLAAGLYIHSFLLLCVVGMAAVHSKASHPV